MDGEHRKLLSNIRAATNESSRVEPPERLVMRALVPNKLDASSSASDGYSSMTSRGSMAAERTLTMKLQLSYEGPATINEVNRHKPCPAKLWAHP